MQNLSTASTYTINVGGKLLELDTPIVMGILNVSPDSFYQHHEGADAIRQRVGQIVAEDAAIIDVGACSTRPGSTPVSEEEETQLLRVALGEVRKEAPEAAVSVDTFRASVARMCIEEYGIQIVNDISGGNMDADMWRTVAELGVPYVLTHNTPISASDDATFMADLLRDMGQRVEKLHDMGVCDILLDPGFGFGKTLEQNYILMRNMEVLHELQLPLLVGISHKSMIYRLLGTTPEQALNGSTVLHTVALQKGAHILRVHEVKEAMECIRICGMLNGKS